MTVLHCINSPSIGGIQKLVIDLAVEQKNQGIDVSVMLDSREGAYLKLLLDNNVEIIDSGISGGYDFSFSKLKKLKSIFSKFEIVHLHNFSMLRLMAISSSNSVYTIHGLSKGVRKENIIKYTFRESLKNYFLNKVDVFIANSEYTLGKAKSHYGLKKTYAKAILNGIPIPSGESHEFQNTNSIFTIGLVSRFTARKRIDRLINAFDMFLKNEGEGQLILVGDGQAIDDIKSQIEKLSLSDHIELVGYTDKVSDYYKQFDICVHPSDNEGFGLVAVEAYLHGLPVVAFNDSGGLVEVVFPIEPENIIENETQLAERLGFYFKNRQHIGDKANERIMYAKTNFSMKRMSSDYNDVYKQLIKGT
ncbi:glycosyltransferase family 4 protein [Psychroserpens sp.]|uniref:glycosyltransferase family 4 protein n=1 Tax=Psychroserpens sp. TaxID=2020870 RepID=UPI002B2758DE|nr:glycosyltransferase family 4 protein [Psychroserpens sp.]